MFQHFRWRIVIWFVGLSFCLYLFSTVAGMIFFHQFFTQALDHELTVAASELNHAIDLRAGKPVFKDWTLMVQAEPSKSLASVQLFDAKGNVTEKHGPPGILSLARSGDEAQVGDKRVRILCNPLLQNGDLVGYLQVELPVSERDDATQNFALTMVIMSPLVFLALGVSSYFVSAKVLRPLQDNVRMLKRFVADAGHELLTPLSIVKARTESLDRKLKRLGVPVDEMRIVESSIERMEKIVSDLMFLSELEGPVLVRPKKQIELLDIVSGCVSQFRSRFDEKGIELVQNGGQSALLKGSPEGMERLVSNLLENAQRYTEPGGRVTVALKADAARALLTVEDTGIGIPKESQALIFERFYCVDESRSRASGGSGLGLSIVKAVAEAHNGSIQVESEPGKGSKFTVFLPLS